MPTVFTHPAIPLVLRAVTGSTRISRRLLGIAAICSVFPDVDTLGFLVGIPYESLAGHRGLTHSLAFALLLTCCALPFAEWLQASRRWVFAGVFLVTASHGVFDALTDDGLGVAFFSPFSNQRFFFPWRPIPASPIGLLEIFSPSGQQVLAAELLLVWLPSLLLIAGAATARRAWRARRLRSAGDRAEERSGLASSARRSLRIGTLLALAATLAGGYGGVRADSIQTTGSEGLVSDAITNLETQAARLGAQPGAACPQDFATLATGRTLRIALFYGSDEHEGRVHDRAHSQAMTHVLTSPCRGQLSTCGFSPVLRSRSVVRVMKSMAGRDVEVTLFTSSLAGEAAEEESPPTRSPEPEWLGQSVKEHFLRELVDSDVVFYMGHSRLGGSIGFDQQTGLTTVVDAIFRRPMRPVLAALRQRPTRLRILGMFSCSSNKYFRQDFQRANPALSLILTTGEINYAPAEQASLGALEAVLSQNCGYAFHKSMISVTESDASMTYLFREMPSPAVRDVGSDATPSPATGR